MGIVKEYMKNEICYCSHRALDHFIDMDEYMIVQCGKCECVGFEQDLDATVKGMGWKKEGL